MPGAAPVGSDGSRRTRRFELSQAGLVCVVTWPVRATAGGGRAFHSGSAVSNARLCDGTHVINAEAMT